MSPYHVVRSVFFGVVALASVVCLWTGFAELVKIESNWLRRYANGQSVNNDETLWVGLGAIKRGTFDKW